MVMAKRSVAGLYLAIPRVVTGTNDWAESVIWRRLDGKYEDVSGNGNKVGL